jgi:hypothetical protein
VWETTERKLTEVPCTTLILLSGLSLCTAVKRPGRHNMNHYSFKAVQALRFMLVVTEEYHVLVKVTDFVTLYRLVDRCHFRDSCFQNYSVSYPRGL